MVILGRVPQPGVAGQLAARWTRRCLALLLLAALPAAGAHARSAPDGPEAQAGGWTGPDTRVLETRLELCPHDADTLLQQAVERVGQGRLGEAEALASCLVRLHPGNAQGWGLLATILYLKDDTRGALAAWTRGRPLQIRDIAIRRVPDRETGEAGREGGSTRLAEIAGLTPGEPLTPEGLLRGERRLRSLPAASRVRLGYRALPGGEADIEGVVVASGGDLLDRPEWLAHGARLLGRRVHISLADPRGHMEAWELKGSMEGTLRTATLSLARPAPRGSGVWRWELEHGSGRYAPSGPALQTSARLERTSVAWTHAQWLSGSFQGRIQGRLDLTPDRGAAAGIGVGGTRLSPNERSSVEAEATGWVPVGRRRDSGEVPGAVGSFGRAAIRVSLHPHVPPLMGAPSGWTARLGVVAVSSELPADLQPRIGAGARSDLLMRARSDLDAGGALRPLYPGRVRVHGGIEFLRPLGSLGPLGIGAAAFAEGIRALATKELPGPRAAPRGAIHLGTGLRVRVPGVDGWLRVDWSLDPADRASRLSAGWVQGVPR